MFDYEYWGNNVLPIKDNMAVEEYLLNDSAKNNVATVRFWNVEKDSVVIGYGESPSNIKRVDSSFDFTRRITGGSHVQFDKNCLAYTITVPRDGSFKHFDDMRKYYADKIVDALSELGVNDIFADNRASTINVNGKVIASHAMFWGVNSALMHGLMLIDHYNVDKLYERMILKDRRVGKNIYREYDALKTAPAAKDLLFKNKIEISDDNKVKYIKEKIAEKILTEITNGKYMNKGLDNSIISNSRSIVASTHTGTPWIKDRAPPYTSENVDSIPGEELAGKLKDNLGYCMYIEVPDRDFSKMVDPVDF